MASSHSESLTPAASASASGLLLTGKTAIVTGSTAGIGKAIAKLFLQHGAFVVVNGRSRASVDAAVQDLITAHGASAANILGVAADVATEAGVATLIAEVDATGRFVDILVNNMGVYSGGDFFASTDADFTSMFVTNVVSNVALSRHYLKPMLAANKGRVLLVSSVVGVVPAGDMLAYSVSKGAQLTLARGLAELTRGTNVTVNSILPGVTETEGLNKILDSVVASGAAPSREAAGAGLFESLAPKALLKRMLTADEVGNIALFLASDLASGVNGTGYRVDGGVVQHI